MKPHSHDVGVARAFDCFCKKVLRNEARDYQDALARKRNREVYFSELPVEVLEQFAVRDTYFTDSRTFEVIGHSVCIDDETLAEAISALPVDRRDITAVLPRKAVSSDDGIYLSELEAAGQFKQ